MYCYMELRSKVSIARFAIWIWSVISIIDFRFQELPFLKVKFHKGSAKRQKFPPAAGQNDIVDRDFDVSSAFG